MYRCTVFLKQALELLFETEDISLVDSVTAMGSPPPRLSNKEAIIVNLVTASGASRVM